MNTWLKYILYAVVFFGVYTLLEYFFSENIDWKVCIIATVVFTIMEIVFDIAQNKKKNK